MSELMNLSNELEDSRERRVWLRAFWGFNPEEGGYMGFTNEGNRARFIREHREGDLVLIYGADQKETARDQRRQLLGFLEVDPIPITDVERSSDVERHRKMQYGWLNRWTHAVPVKRAWRITRRIEAHNLARYTFESHNPVLIASRCELLSPEEAKASLALPVIQANVFGMPSLSEEQVMGEVPIQSFFMPSKGVTPSFGTRSFTVTDADNRLYVLTLEGNVSTFLGRQPFETIRKVVVKVGYGKEPQLRCDAHNAHLPPACAFRWKVALLSQPLSGAEKAKEAEDKLKGEFHRRFESLGREFYLVDEQALSSEFSRITGGMFMIKAP